MGGSGGEAGRVLGDGRECTRVHIMLRMLHVLCIFFSTLLMINISFYFTNTLAFEHLMFFLRTRV